MNEKQGILFPTDFSEASLQAFPHALELARRIDAVITVLYVHMPFADDPYNESACPDLASHVKGFVDRKFADLRAMVPGERPEIKLEEIRNISAAAGILECLEDLKFEIVVLGKHGNSRILKFLLGSVTEKVVRYSPIPVLIVGPDHEGYRSSPVYRNILVPYDFSRYARAAVEKGLRISRLYGAKMWIIYVIEQEPFPGQIDSLRTPAEKTAPDLLEELRITLIGELGIEGIDDVETEIQIRQGEGKAHAAICSYIDDKAIDLVVMGTYGLSGFEKVLLGSTTERVVRMATCPVMAFHLRDSE